MKKLSFLIRKNEFIIFSSLLLVIIIISNLILTYFLNNNSKNKPNDLIIISHPGDELIYAGSHLLEGNYLIVCLTCSNNDKEFINLINYTKDNYILLDYSEDTFKDNLDNIKEDLNDIITSQKWNSIITHNPDGEYGHSHHKLTSNIVTELTNNNLYYFGKYYSPNTVKYHYHTMTKIPNIDDKYYLLSFYARKDLEIDFTHIFNYEEWTPSSKWGDSR